MCDLFLAGGGGGGRRVGRVRDDTGRLAVESHAASLEADEGGVDLANSRQRQHDLPSVLGILL